MLPSSITYVVKLALHALQDVADLQQASLKGCIALLRALPPHGGNLYSVLLARVFKETGFRADRTGIIFGAMQGDARMAPADWDIRPWRQLLSIYGRCAIDASVHKCLPLCHPAEAGCIPLAPA